MLFYLPFRAEDTEEVMAIIRGNNSNNVLRGTSKSDTIYGLNGNDRLFGLAGDDILIGGLGKDRLVGGPGEDTASYAFARTKVNVELGSITMGAGEATGDTFVSIENIIGSRYDDFLMGDRRGNDIFGGRGMDVIYGKRGNDMLDGGVGNDDLIPEQGNDIVKGGAGRDAIYFSFENQGVRLFLNANDSGRSTIGSSHDTVSGVEVIYGSAFNDQLRVGKGGYIYGNAGNDLVRDSPGSATREILDGGDGYDTLDGRFGEGSDLFTLGSNYRFLGFDARNSADNDLLYVDRSIFNFTGQLSGSDVVSNAGGTATIAGPQFIFNTTTDQLWYDADGTGFGSAFLVATFDASCILVGNQLSAADFLAY
jgi:Ca2+-binding RTX toxin-like protein